MSVQKVLTIIVHLTAGAGGGPGPGHLPDGAGGLQSGGPAPLPALPLDGSDRGHRHHHHGTERRGQHEPRGRHDAQVRDALSHIHHELLSPSFRLVAALYTGDLSPFHKGNNFWMIPFLVPYLGSVIAVCVYSFFIERLSVTYRKSKSVISSDIKFTGS